MSDISDDGKKSVESAERGKSDPVGYGKPPVEHQFKKGTSGNQKGRPPKRQRSLIPRQLRNDVLKVQGMTVAMNTSKGETKVTAYEAAMMALFKKSMSGQYSATKLFLEKCEDAVQQHYDAHWEFEILENLEKWAATHDLTPAELKQLEKWRRETRKI